MSINFQCYVLTIIFMQFKWHSLIIINYRIAAFPHKIVWIKLSFAANVMYHENYPKISRTSPCCWWVLIFSMKSNWTANSSSSAFSSEIFPHVKFNAWVDVLPPRINIKSQLSQSKSVHLAVLEVANGEYGDFTDHLSKAAQEKNWRSVTHVKAIGEDSCGLTETVVSYLLRISAFL